MRRLLFVCARNRLRSPTAEAVFASINGVEVSSAGTAPDAECVISADLIEWADELYVMEKRQVKILRDQFANSLSGRRIACRNIPDRYKYMQPELVELLKAKMRPYLSSTGNKEATYLGGRSRTAKQSTYGTAEAVPLSKTQYFDKFLETR